MPKHLDFRPIDSAKISLRRLAEELSTDLYAELSDVEVTGISLDSQQLRPGDIFAALSGKFRHGSDFATQAIASGAVALLTDQVGRDNLQQQGIAIPVLVSEFPRRTAALAAELLYTRGKKLPERLGVTGTNGKTMTVYLLDEIAGLLGLKTAVSTTAERRIGSSNLVGGLTTPESTEMFALLGVMAEQSVDLALLEVSAQAMTHSRVVGQHFSVVSFLNLSHDHLDDYPDLESYYQAKAALFTPEYTEHAIISLDTEWGERLARETTVDHTTLTWAHTETSGVAGADWTVQIVEQELTLTRFVLEHRVEGHRIEASVELFGEQVVFDASVAILMMLSSGVSLQSMQQTLASHPIPWTAPGRMEILSSGNPGPMMILDYGHTPEAFRHSLNAIRSVHQGKVVMLFGVDGDRDTTKRAAMAEQAAAGSDAVVITDYNPRFEDPAAIRKTLLDAVRQSFPERELYEEADPARAIRLALRLAGDDGLVFWAGPGHEAYREVRGERVNYSSREDTLVALNESGWLS